MPSLVQDTSSVCLLIILQSRATPFSPWSSGETLAMLVDFEHPMIVLCCDLISIFRTLMAKLRCALFDLPLQPKSSVRLS